MLYPKSDGVPTHWPRRISGPTPCVPSSTWAQWRQSRSRPAPSKKDPQKNSSPTSRGPAPGLPDISEQEPARGRRVGPAPGSALRLLPLSKQARLLSLGEQAGCSLSGWGVLALRERGPPGVAHPPWVGPRPGAVYAQNILAVIVV